MFLIGAAPTRPTHLGAHLHAHLGNQMHLLQRAYMYHVQSRGVQPPTHSLHVQSPAALGLLQPHLAAMSSGLSSSQLLYPQGQTMDATAAQVRAAGVHHLGLDPTQPNPGWSLKCWE